MRQCKRKWLERQYWVELGLKYVPISKTFNSRIIKKPIQMMNRNRINRTGIRFKIVKQLIKK